MIGGSYRKRKIVTKEKRDGEKRRMRSMYSDWKISESGEKEKNFSEAKKGRSKVQA